MPRFSFHFASNNHFLLDEIGKDLDSLYEAHAHALKMIRGIQSILPDEEDWLGWTVEVTDESGQRVLTVLFPSPQKANRLDSASSKRGRTELRGLAPQEP